MKGKNKLISLIFAVAVLLTLLIPPVLNAISANGVNESFVSAISIKETITGLAPFDNDNNPGNDANAENNIVRSFDNVNYTLEYITALKSNTPITDAYLCVEFIIPYTKEIATFDLETMTWIENPVVTETNGKQILTGRRYLKNTTSNNAIPGEGTLSVGIKVQAAPNGTKIQPEFKLYMEGNTTNEAKTIKSKEITVSAAPKYDIEIKKSTYVDDLKYFDTTTGNYSEQPIPNGKKGRIQSYGIALRLHNESTSKGLKGIELPTGTIEFDLIFEEGLSLEDSGNITSQQGYTPFIWDYKTNDFNSNNGILGRNIRWKWGNYSIAAHTLIPASKGGGASECYDSGNWTITQTNENSLHIKINNYKFSPNFEFPTKHINDAASIIRNGDNIGYFSTYYFQAVCQFPEEVQNVTNIYLTAKVENFKATSVTGQLNTDVLPNNNKLTAPITLYPKGNITKNTVFRTAETNLVLMPNWTEHGDSSLFKNQLFRAQQEIINSSDYTIKSYDLLSKFDNEGFEFPSQNELFLSVTPYFGTDGTTTTLRQLFAAKPDKTGWINHDEMISTTQEQLIYFDNINELRAQGYVCVGVLHEGRGCDYAKGPIIQFMLRTKNSTTVGQTYAIISNIRIWENNTEDFSMLNYSYNNGYVLNDEGYVEGYPTPTKKLDTPYYVKTEYNNGVIISGTHAGGILYGNTILIKGYDAIISKKISDIDISGTPKTVYDMDANERTVNYELQPEAKSTIKGQTTNLYITDNLPKDLSYIQGTSYYGNTSLEPTTIKNSDGTTTLKWTLENVPIGETLPKITFSCTIGKAGTNQDVQNNQNIKNIVTIYGDEDVKEFKLISGNMAEVTFQVVKLSAISISKSTDTPYISLGQDFNFTLKYANNSENPLYNSKLYDILPYKGDVRGSDFEGFYKINNIVINFTSAPKTFVDFTANNYMVGYITNKNIPTNDFTAISTINNWTEITNKTVDTNNKTITYTGLPEDVTGLIFNMKLEGLEYIEITLNMSPTGAQEEGDKYFNGFYQYANGQVEQVHSNHVLVQVYGHLDVTKIWQDDNNRYNTRPSNLDIKIYQDIHDYKTVTLNSNNAVTNASYKWTQRVDNVPMYDTQGNPYVYTIEEDTIDINSNFYFDAIYDQSNLTVTNIGIWVKNNNYPEYIIIVNKDIINKNNQTATVDDFNKIKLNNNQEFQIVLKQLNRTIINNGTTLSESYSGYSGNEYHGLVTDTNQLIFRNIPAGKYEISENIIQYFEFIGIEKIENSEHATFTQENGKYYITLSGLHENNEYVEVKVTNKIEDFRPYDKSPSKDNLFNIS